MTELREKSCEVCHIGAPMISGTEARKLLAQLPAWDIVDDEGVEKLRRIVIVRDFEKAMKLANEIGELAEEEDHHPLLIVEWGKLTIFWWTHKIKGLHKNDFIMAAKTDFFVED
ncbi:4a-hydroxytetrahydrobiopterin dehydratase [Puteibacter caeruleilacunae]|nr:4a-hydroxytetrahydrobiopterin dehydratase [Puteibacter caeruleilacunae]